MSQGYRDGMREGLHIPSSNDDTKTPVFGDLLKVLEIPDLLTHAEWLWYRDQLRKLLGLPPYPTEEYVHPDTPLPGYGPEEYLP